MGQATASEEFSALVRSRRSVRDFLPDPVPDQMLAAVLEDSAWAPSWSNTQPYLVAVADGARRDRLSAELQHQFDAGLAARDGGPLDKVRALVTRTGIPNGDFDTTLEYPDELQPFRRATGFGLYETLHIDRGDRAARDAQLRRNFEFFGAPVAVFLFVHSGLKEFAVLDAGIWLQTFMLSAHAHGLATCAQGALATWPDPVRKAFDVPDRYKLVCGVSLGYASDHPVNSFNPGRRGLPRADPRP